MPIKWSALRVNEAMYKVEQQVSMTEPFLGEARARVEVARQIADLPQYIDQYLVRLIVDIDRIDYVKSTIKAVRDAIPDGAIETEQDRIRHGNWQSLI